MAIVFLLWASLGYYCCDIPYKCMSCLQPQFLDKVTLLEEFFYTSASEMTQY